MVDALAEYLDAALGGTRPPASPTGHAMWYDWDAISGRQASNGAW